MRVIVIGRFVEEEILLRSSKAKPFYSFPHWLSINLIGLSKASIPMNEANSFGIRHQIAANEKGISQKTLNQPLKRITKPNLSNQTRAHISSFAHSGTSSIIATAPSRPTVIMASPKVFVAKPASQYEK
jgi:hypothetical protein